MKASFGQLTYSFVPWEPSHGVVLSSPFAFDCETTLIPEDRRWVVPDYVLGAAFDGVRGFFIQRKSLAEFFPIHAGVDIIFHHAPFDLAVIHKVAPEPDIYRRVDENRVWDTRILHRLFMLGSEGHTANGSGESTLETCCARYLGVNLPKDIQDSAGQPVRLSYGKWLERPPQEIEPVYLDYLAKDAIVTHAIYSELWLRLSELLNESQDARGYVSEEWLHEQVRRWGPQTHHIQLKASVVLQEIEANGLCVDRKQQAQLCSDFQHENDAQLELLRGLGYAPGTGSQKQLLLILGEFESKHPQHRLPRTAKGNYSTSAESLREFADESPFIRAYLSYQAASLKLKYVEKMAVDTLHPSFDPLKVTGRTSSFGEINAQSIPREEALRSCFVPSEGHVFIDADYKTLELVTLAQSCISQFNLDSEMARAIDRGEDLHSVIAAKVIGKPEIEVTKGERQKAKAINFGKPGGMGLDALRSYAKVQFGVLLSDNEIDQFTEVWFNTFPEMHDFLRDDAGDLGARIATFFNFTLDDFRQHTGKDWSRSGQGSSNAPHSPNSMLGWMFRKVLTERDPTTGTGRPYSSEEVDYFWGRALLRADGLPASIKKGIEAREPSSELAKRVLWLAENRGVFTLTGRLRGRSTYTQRCNAVFQGLAADGTKIALWKLWRAGFRIVNFVHDEVLIEVRADVNLNKATQRVQDLMISGMREIVPDIRVDVDLTVSSCWSKEAKLLMGANGRVLVWSPPPQLSVDEVDVGQCIGTTVEQLAICG